MAYRLGTSTNLPAGSSYDLLLISTNEGYPEGKLTFEIANTPRKITGVQKVAQLFFKMLMSRKGSDPIHPNAGTSFYDYAVGTNRTGVDTNIYSALINEVADAEQQVKYILNGAGYDPSSQLDNITVLGVDSSKESIVLFVKLVTIAGEQASISIPFPQLDLQLSQNG